MNDTGKCANCGQVTVDGSTLCIDCIPAKIKAVSKEDDKLICLGLQLRLHKSLMKHVFAEYQKLQKVVAEKDVIIKELEDEVWDLKFDY